MTVKPCKDCVLEGTYDPRRPRPASEPGPRCATHWRAEKARRKVAAHDRHVETGFGISGRWYDALKASQGGVCYICRKGKGIARALAVDHDHSCTMGHPPEVGCPWCIRCLCCARCNELLGFLDVDALQRAIEVLTDPPARKVLPLPEVVSSPKEAH